MAKTSLMEFLDWYNNFPSEQVMYGQVLEDKINSLMELEKQQIITAVEFTLRMKDSIYSLSGEEYYKILFQKQP
jgi:hypothetical protein